MSPLTPQPPTCLGCPAHGWSVGFVGFQGPPDSRLVLVGQGPGESEAYSSRPFHPRASAGSRLDKWLYQASLQRTQICVGNLVQCWLPKFRNKGSASGNRDPLRAEVEWCWNAHTGPWLHGWDRRMRAHGGDYWLTPVGVPATKWLLGIPWDKGGERFAGTVQVGELPPVRENPSG